MKTGGRGPPATPVRLDVSGFLHRTHYRADDRRQDRAAADTADRIAEHAAQRAAGRRIGACLAADEHVEDLPARDAADCAAEDLGS